MEYYARFYGSRGPPMSAAAYKATSNPRSGGSFSSDSHHPLPQVPEIPSTDDEEIDSSSLVAQPGVTAIPTSAAAAAADLADTPNVTSSSSSSTQVKMGVG